VYLKQLTLSLQYIGAAKDAWALLTDRGIDALVNDSLISMSKGLTTPRFGSTLTFIISCSVGRIRRRRDLWAVRVPLPAMYVSPEHLHLPTHR
jgi:hypothetical protein